MPIKAGDASGYFLQSNIAKAVIYAYEHGADVINMSFGGSACTIAVQDALSMAYSRCVLVASAGNDAYPNENTRLYDALPFYPAALSYVIGVMSIDWTGMESNYTNWDCKLNNSVEYEVYAPGEGILSTIPGDNYMTMSGTSMAAPVVAAEAALLRSYYTDTNAYSTKFIYGQIIGTANGEVECCNENSHMVSEDKHNLPGYINCYDALVKMPVPSIGVSSYNLFDTPGYTQDTEGITAGCEAINNGDGVIDAGETVALGFTLKNRWGIGKNTIVHLDVTSDAGVANPYVSILNNDISYGDIGTYSETNCGKVYENDKWTAWERPFYLKIADDSPNDMTVTVNVTINSENGLDEEKGVVSSRDYIQFQVRKGVILPNRVTEDLVLTKENYYILPNAMTIAEGATVTAEAGTKIQFWCSDSEDVYTDSSIVYMDVKGRFICKGTAEEPVEIFPSDWMGAYAVQITSSGNGLVHMEYTDVVNPLLIIDDAIHCKFRQNYRKRLYYRELSQGQIIIRYTEAKATIKNAQYCAFYKVGGETSYFHAGGNQYRKCLFTGSAIQYDNSTIYKDCIFYGNNNYSDSELGMASSFQVSNKPQGNVKIKDIIYNEDTGTTYLVFDTNETRWELLSRAENKVAQTSELYNDFAKLFGGALANFETKEELAYVSENLNGKYFCGLHKDRFTGKYYGTDGQELSKSLSIEDSGEVGVGYVYNNKVWFKDGDGEWQYFLIEIPGKVYVKEIYLEDYVVDLDIESKYAIYATTSPAVDTEKDLIYESEDESVAIVDEKGMVTPTGIGTVNIRVYSEDLAVYNYLTVNVKEQIPLQGLKIKQGDFDLSIGTQKRITLELVPVDTTQTAVTFVSSDPEIASVSDRGIVSALTEGDVMITAVSADGKSDSIVVHCVIPVESITFEEQMYVTTFEQEDESVFYPKMMPENATKQELEWESSNPEICYVNEEGKLVKEKEGIATLRAKVKGSGLKADIQVAVTNGISEAHIVKMQNYNPIQSYDYLYHFALLDNGTLWIWGGQYKTPRRLNIEGVKDFTIVNNNSLYILDTAGTVKLYGVDSSFSGTFEEEGYFNPLKNITALAEGNVGRSFYAISEDGSVWAWGDNQCGQLGVGMEEEKIYTPMQMELDADIVKAVSFNCSVALLDETGNVYAAGGWVSNARSPELVTSGAKDIRADFDNFNQAWMEKDEKNLMLFSHRENNTDISEKYLKTVSGEIHNNRHDYYIQEGIVYARDNCLRVSNAYGQLGTGIFSEFAEYYLPMLKVQNAVKVYDFGNNLYVQTSDGAFYATGKGDDYSLGNADANHSSVPVRVYFGLTQNEAPLVLQGFNGTEQENGTIRVSGKSLVLDYSEVLEKNSNFGSITLTNTNGDIITIKKELDMDKMILTPRAELKNGEAYTLTIPVGALMSKFSSSNEEAVLEFTYVAESAEGGSQPEESPVIHETIIDNDKIDERHKWDRNEVLKLWETYNEEGRHTTFSGNVILNRIHTEALERWMRFYAGNSANYKFIGLSGNYWGTQSSEMINKQIVDFDDYQSLIDIREGEILTNPPTDTFPYVVDAYLQVDGEQTEVVGNDLVTFVVEFNRDMDTEGKLQVAFGSSYPYGDYIVEGAYVSPTRWEGTLQLTTLIEGGTQYLSIRNGTTADGTLPFYEDLGRFSFKIDTTSAQSMSMQADVKAEGIQLYWQQDDFDTLAGYNVYRATKEDGFYSKLNRTVIPANTKEWFDDGVEPGQRYYYNFTVVKSDMTESEPSGKIVVTAMDTMAPNIYHTPVYQAFTGSNLVISAVIIDNVSVNKAVLYYRVKGDDTWKRLNMNANNDKFSAVIPAVSIVEEGLQYYIEADDGGLRTYKGSAEEPFEVVVQAAVSDNALGDVDGNGVIELKDAMMVLLAVNDRLNLTEEEFRRADLDKNGELSAKEALRILQYVNGKITSILP